MQKSTHKNKGFIFDSCNDPKFAIYLFTVYHRAKKKLSVFIKQRFARMFEAYLERCLIASRLVGEPIKCSHLTPLENCD